MADDLLDAMDGLVHAARFHVLQAHQHVAWLERGHWCSADVRKDVVLKPSRDLLARGLGAVGRGLLHPEARDLFEGLGGSEDLVLFFLVSRLDRIEPFGDRPSRVGATRACFGQRDCRVSVSVKADSSLR